MKQNFLKNKTKQFALSVTDCYKYLIIHQKEYVISTQLLRSGTSVGAMVREAEFGQSKADYIHKLSIAQKEINESIYWLELLVEANYIDNILLEDLSNNAVEIIKLLTSSIKTAKGIKH